MTALDPLDLLKAHGGNPGLLSRTLGIAESELVDLSSAVSPFPYPLPDIPVQRLTQLPYHSDLLAEVAAEYYGVRPEQLLAGAGSQQFIQCLPALRKPCTVLLPRLGYAEHAHHWQAQGHRCEYYDNADAETVLEAIAVHHPEVLVVIHPNNPSAERVTRADVLAWQSRLPASGQIIVDEAFVDIQPEASIVPLLPLPGLVVLRSGGKFFGLPGLRLGFLLADEVTVAAVAEALGPWPVNSLAQWAGEIMLADRAWQKQAQARLLAHSAQQFQRVRDSLGAMSASITSTAYFISARMPHELAAWLCREMLQRHIVLRYYDQHSDYACLRIGLAASESELMRLESALTALVNLQAGLSNRAI